MDNNIQKTYIDDEQEIDIVELIKKVWKKRKLIIKTTIVFAVLGVVVALFSPKEYSSGCVMVPQAGSSKGGGSLSSLASMAGFSIGDVVSSDGTISPTIYPMVLENIEFRKELMRTPIKFEEYDQPIPFIDYYTNPEYAKFSLIGTIKKYTIGLPSLILSSLRKEKEELPSSHSNSTLHSLSKEEYDCSKILSEKISLTVEEKKGFITLTTSMSEPLAAAQLAEATLSLLQKYITKYKIEKAVDNQKYIQERYDDAKAFFEEKQVEYAEFKDANRMLSTATAQIMDSKLQNEYSLAYSLYSQLAGQLVNADLKVKEDTPVLTIIKPITIPRERSKPQRAKIVVIWTFLGFILSAGSIFAFDWTKENFNWCPKPWRD